MSSATATPAEGSLAAGSAATETRPATLGEALRGHSNALGLIRLVLAALVIVDHAFPLGGFGADPVWALTRGQTSLGLLAVGGFFAISGYLIAKSGMSGDILQFLWRRFLRIFPAFWAVLLVTALVVAPLLWIGQGKSLAGFLGMTPNGPLRYLSANWTLHIGSYGIGDLLTDTTPYGQELGRSVFNGSLWTLSYEWSCYLLIGVLLAFGILARARIVVPVVTAFLFIVQLIQLADPQAIAAILPVLDGQYRISLTLTFMVGACLAVYSRSIPFDDRLGVLSGLIVAVTLRFGGFAVIGVVAGAYFVMYLGARLPAAVRWVGAKNDYSYGIYIYGFLVQQVLASLGVHRLGYLPYVLIALVITFGCAWLSWHGIEKRAMALKEWGPGRGWRFWLERLRAAFARRGRRRIRQ